MRIGPLIRKLVFWGAHSIFEGSQPKRGPNIDFTKKMFRTKVFCLIETKRMSLIS